MKHILSSTIVSCLSGAILSVNGVWAAGGIDVAGPVTLRALPSSNAVPVPVCFDPGDGKLGSCQNVFPGNVIYVEQQPGGDFSSPIDAINAITDASADNPYLILIGPGIYDLGSSELIMKPYVYIKGAGKDITTLVGHRLDATGTNWSAGSFVKGVSNSSLRDLTVHNDCGTGTSGLCGAIYNNNNASPVFNRIRVKVTGGTNTVGIHNNASSSPSIKSTTVVAAGGGGSTGMYSYSNCQPDVIRSKIKATGTGFNAGVWTKGNSKTQIAHSTIKGSGLTVRTDGPGSTTNIFASKLSGGVADAISGGTAPKCAGVTDENYDFFSGPACP